MSVALEKAKELWEKAHPAFPKERDQFAKYLASQQIRQGSYLVLYNPKPANKETFTGYRFWFLMPKVIKPESFLDDVKQIAEAYNLRASRDAGRKLTLRSKETAYPDIIMTIGPNFIEVSNPEYKDAGELLERIGYRLFYASDTESSPAERYRPFVLSDFEEKLDELTIKVRHEVEERSQKDQRIGKLGGELRKLNPDISELYGISKEMARHLILSGQIWRDDIFNAIVGKGDVVERDIARYVASAFYKAAWSYDFENENCSLRFGNTGWDALRCLKILMACRYLFDMSIKNLQSFFSENTSQLLAVLGYVHNECNLGCDRYNPERVAPRVGVSVENVRKILRALARTRPDVVRFQRIQRMRKRTESYRILDVKSGQGISQLYKVVKEFHSSNRNKALTAAIDTLRSMDVGLNDMRNVLDIAGFKEKEVLPEIQKLKGSKDVDSNRKNQ